VRGKSAGGRGGIGGEGGNPCAMRESKGEGRPTSRRRSRRAMAGTAHFQPLPPVAGPRQSPTSAGQLPTSNSCGLNSLVF